jgi:hypothetical protein
MKRQQLFGIFKRDKDGNILGYVEHSFHMSWNVFFVRRWTKRELKSLSLDPDFRKPGVFFLRLTRTKHKDIKLIGRLIGLKLLKMDAAILIGETCHLNKSIKSNSLKELIR